MVASVFSYTHSMCTNVTLDKKFEWKHTKEDHLVVLEYQFLHTCKSEFGLAARRKSRLIIFLIFCAPITILYFVNLNQQDIESTLVVSGIMAFIFWMLVIKKPKPETIEASTKKIAKRYIEGAGVIPTGTHRLSTDGNVLEWCWVDGNEKSSYPVSQVEDIRDSTGRLYFIRKGEVTDSIPFHAFGDQSTRLAFVELIQTQMGKKGDVRL